MWANRLGALCKRDRETVANFPPFRTGKSFHPFLPQLASPIWSVGRPSPKTDKTGRREEKGEEEMPQPSGDYTALKSRCDKRSHSPHRPRPTEDPSRFQSESRKTEAIPTPSTVQTELKKAFPDFFFYEPVQPSYRVRKLSAHAPASIFFPPASFPPLYRQPVRRVTATALPPALFALSPCHVPSPPPSPLRQPLIKKVHALPSPSKAQDLNNRCRRRLEGDDAINHSKESVTLPPSPLPSSLTSKRKERRGG